MLFINDDCASRGCESTLREWRRRESDVSGGNQPFVPADGPAPENAPRDATGAARARDEGDTRGGELRIEVSGRVPWRCVLRADVRGRPAPTDGSFVRLVRPELRNRRALPALIFDGDVNFSFWRRFGRFGGVPSMRFPTAKFLGLRLKENQ